MATTSPRSFSTGPPLEPGLIGAEICTICRPSTSRTALTMPVLTVRESPCGLPTATTGAPTAGRVPVVGSIGRSKPGILRTAMSAPSSPSSACTRSYRSPLVRMTTARLAPSITWKLVTTTPVARTRKPLPMPRVSPEASKV